MRSFKEVQADLRAHQNAGKAIEKELTDELIETRHAELSQCHEVDEREGRTNACMPKVAEMSPAFYTMDKIAAWETREDGLLHCSYCGSIYPADAARLLKVTGTQFSGADWKYGWPHKFYIEPVNPDPKEEAVGWESGPSITENTPGAIFEEGRWVKVTMGKKSHLFLKLYNIHLKDAPDQVFEEFAAMSVRLFGVKWERDEKGLKYSAPRGIQRFGVITVNEGVSFGWSGREPNASDGTQSRPN